MRKITKAYPQKVLREMIEDFRKSLKNEEGEDPHISQVKAGEAIRAIDILNKMNGFYTNETDDKEVVIKIDLT